MLSQGQDNLNLIKISEIVVQNTCAQSIKCFYKNVAREFCSNQKCIQKFMFTCRQEKCICQQQHKMCQKKDLLRSLQTIKSKISKTEDIKLYIKNTFNKIYRDVNDLKDYLLKQVDERMKFMKLYEQQKKLYLMSVNQLNLAELSGKGAILWKEINMRNDCKANLFQGTKQVLQNYQDLCKQNILKVKKDIEKLIKKQELFPIKISSQIQIKKEKTQIHSKFQLNRNLLMFGKFDQLNSFFSPKKVKRLKLLYKASQHNFSLQKYYQFCGSKQNTIIIALTSKGKIFGGFTPFCLWSGKDEWMKDDKKQTFLFSLSQNQKISLNETKCAVCRFASKNNRIQFGGDFYISDKANVQSSWVGNCYYYLNSKYKQDKQSYLKLNGGQSGQCLLQEWEAYGLQFEQ